MKVEKKVFIYIIFILAIIVFTKTPDGNTQSLSDLAIPEGLIPENISIQEIYQPAYGTPVGKINIIQGRAVIIHSEDINGYIVKQNCPIFKKDTLITMDKSRLSFELIDGSVMTMASNSKMKFSEAVFDEQTKTRTSFINMALGKVRFIVKKLKDFNESKFTIKTKTAVVGVRGSDFIINTTQNITEVTTLDDTVLEIISLKNLEKPPVLLQNFEQIHIESGFLPSKVMPVSPEKIQDMIKDMSVSPGNIEPGKLTDIRKERIGKTENRMQPSHISGIEANEEKQAGPKPDKLDSGKLPVKPDSPAPAPEKAPVPPPQSAPEPAGKKFDGNNAPPLEKGPDMLSPPAPELPGKMFDEAMKNNAPPPMEDDKLLKPGEFDAPIKPEHIVIPGMPDEKDMIKHEDFIRQENEKIIERTVEDIKKLPDLPKPPF